MHIEILVPSPGESITRVQIAKWLAVDGETIAKDQEIVEIDSDKASFPIAAPESGTLKIMVPEGETVAVGSVIATIEPTPDSGKKPETIKLPPVVVPEKKDNPADKDPHPVDQTPGINHIPESFNASPLAKKIIQYHDLSPADIVAVYPGKKITRKDIETFILNRKTTSEPVTTGISRESDRKKLSTLRIKLAERLVSVKNQTAMLTTFNEVNMEPILKIKEQYTAEFKEHHGVGIGLMSFFTKAVTTALTEFPLINSQIEGDELVTPRYVDIGIAVSAPKGLVVPVLRNAESMSLPEIEQKIKELAGKARDNKITLDDMKGGTFTITNGGVFGSLMSTPIINPPQSAILGMHKIQERPVARDGKVIIAPMMYVALSYDHRVIDGRESVGFLVKIKELLETPELLLTSGIDPVRLLLDL